MSIEDDVALLERVPTLRLLGTTALRMLAIGSEQRDFARGDLLFSEGDDADAGFIVQRGAFRINDGGGAEIVAGPGVLITQFTVPSRITSSISGWPLPIRLVTNWTGIPCRSISAAVPSVASSR